MTSDRLVLQSMEVIKMVERKVQLGFRVSRELRNSIWRQAKKENVRPSDLIRRLLSVVCTSSN